MTRINWHPNPGQLRTFGLTSLVIFGALGTLVWYRQTFLHFDLGAESSLALATGMWTVAAVSGLLALVAPRMLRPFFLVLSVITYPIGYVVSHLVLIVVFYGVLTPIGVALRVFRGDFLGREIDRDRLSYWIERPKVRDMKRYLRQY